MKRLTIVCLAIAIICSIGCSQRSGKPRVLVFSKTAGFRHSSIPDGRTAIMKLGAENGFIVDTTENADYFNEDSLKNYSAIIFLHTTGDFLDGKQEADFERYIQAGGNYVGIHAASDGEYDWGWYGRLVGAYFLSHPQQQEAVLNIKDNSHISTKHLPAVWKRKDEWYNFKKLSPDVKVLITIDEKSYEGGKNGDNHPMAWYHEYDGGRAWYTELGHTEESFKEDNFLKHLLGGIQYAIGDNNALDYAKAKTGRVPDADRFTKRILTQGTLFEPTEMTVLPNLDILIAQRRGEFMLYKNSDKSVKQVGALNVYWKTNTDGVNAEEGLLGLQADPNYDKNHFVYVYYSPKDTSVNRLSRFKFENEALDLKSEKVILELYSQREICCHTGGSIAFGKDNLLFVSTGDNSTPFDEPKQKYVSHGYAPLDDRKGHEQYDARRSSGNTNDLRGKILRIKIKEDGTYDIPEGNLFPKGTANTRPEIYVMGNRNPYRISVDQKNNNLYWGEVGPDANSDSLGTRGPKGYDEVNQARQAGFFGWPLFVGNNYAYHEYDYATGKTGIALDPAKPVNNSRNNTGLQNLPPAQPAFIWYPYGPSPDFPQVGTGGRNAMAGPVYYTDMYPKESRLPDYYNGKLLVYDWIRGWVKAVTMQSNGDFDKMEAFIPNVKFASPIDMEVGPDGKLYFLEYGSGWFSKNPDAGLSVIDFIAGNRAPKLANLKVDKNSGALPFKVKATVDAVDPEKDNMTFVWDLGNGEKKETTEPTIEYTYSKVGDYTISVEASDKDKATTKSEAVSVYAGNETPNVTINLAGNKTFYFPGKPVNYSVSIEDKDDTAKAMDLSNLIVSADYIEGTDKAGSSMGHLVLTSAAIGKNTMLSLDCKTCHKVDEKSIGPSFTDVAKRYAKDPNSSNYLTEKIIKGGSGVWGEVAMAAHPDLKEADAKMIVAWIQSLSATASKKSLPASGTLQPTLNKPAKDNGVLVISASYTDQGGNNIKPMTGNNSVALRSNKMTFHGVTKLDGFTSAEFQGLRFMITPRPTGWFSLDDIDLSGINSAMLMVNWQVAAVNGYDFELRLDAPDGKKIGEGTLPGGLPTKGGFGGAPVQIKIEPVADGRLHSLYIVSKVKDAKEPNQVVLAFIQFNQ